MSKYARVAQRQSAGITSRESGVRVPSPRTNSRPFLIWGQKLGKAQCPYMRRWVMDFRLFSLRLHHWYSSDDSRAFHDHGWNFLVFLFCGSYRDVTPKGSELLFAPRIVFRKAEHEHIVKVAPGGCWTFLITGKERRQWGFWKLTKTGRVKFIKKNRYFHHYGPHPCGGKYNG